VGALVDRPHLALFRGKRVMVTGHTGFKGTWLSLILTMLGAEVMGYALPPENEESHFSRLGLDKRMRSESGDVRDADRLSAVVKSFQPEIVFHLAAQSIVRKSYADPKYTFDVNVGGGVNLLEALRGCDALRALVFITSDKCYENVEWIWGYRETDTLGGHDPYSASKAAAEIMFSSYLRSFLVQKPNLGAATARAGNVIGGGDWTQDRIVPDCMRALLAQQPVIIRSPDATRPWQHVLEPLSGYINLAYHLYEHGQNFNGAWNFGPPIGDAQTVLDVARGLAERFEQAKIEVIRPEGQPHEATLLQLNSDKARQRLGWHTRWDFHKTISATANWYQDVVAKGLPAYEVSRHQIMDYYGGSID
jgi:CDP-glucose 4,6-dehydratase